MNIVFYQLNQKVELGKWVGNPTGGHTATACCCGNVTTVSPDNVQGDAKYVNYYVKSLDCEILAIKYI